MTSTDIAAIKRRYCKRSLYRKIVDRIASWLDRRQRFYALRVLHLSESEYRRCLLGMMVRESAELGMYGNHGDVTTTVAMSREQKRVEFHTVLGSAKRANKLIADIDNLADRTWIDSPRLMAVAHRLLCLGHEPESVPAELEKMIDEAETRV